MDNGTLSQNDNSLPLNSPTLDPFFSSSVINPDPVKFIDSVVRETINLGASDIFFEPQERDLRVRARIDGVLHELGRIELDMYDQISSRVKVLASLDPTERRKIQEGQISLDLEGKIVNLRVEIVQTVNGELIVIRIH